MSAHYIGFMGIQLDLIANLGVYLIRISTGCNLLGVWYDLYSQSRLTRLSGRLGKSWVRRVIDNNFV